MNRENLLKAAAFLEQDAENPQGIKFDLGLWGQWDFKEANSPTISCNTTGCAVGAFAISGIFPGFSYGIYDINHIYPIYKDPETGEVYEEFDAVKKIFGINYAQAEYLFIDNSYPFMETKGREGELNVAKRIRSFVEDMERTTP